MEIAVESAKNKRTGNPVELFLKKIQEQPQELGSNGVGREGKGKEKRSVFFKHFATLRQLGEATVDEFLGTY